MGSNLKGKLAIVTGGAGGVGKEICKQLLKEGVTTILADVNEKAIKNCVTNLSSSEGSIIGFKLDVSNEGSWSSLLNYVSSEFGKCDILINNAAILRTGNLVESDVSLWNIQSKINVDGVILGCKTFIPSMIENNNGHVVNVSSLGGMIGLPGWSYYSASKFAVIGFSQCLSEELEGTKVNLSIVCPGGIDTKMNDNLTVDMGDEPLIHPAKVAELIIDQIKSSEPKRYVFTHPVYRDMLKMHFDSILDDYSIN